jgi:hypothetical protein
MVVWVNRFLVVGIPLLIIAIPVFRTVPTLYRWRIRRSIYRWYGELRFTENAVRRGEGDPVAQRARLERMEQRLERLWVPAAYAADFYNLRNHIRMVRDELRGPKP